MWKKRGYSLVESVVSLALIAIIAAGVFSTVAISAKHRTEDAAALSAVKIVNNVIECFKCDDFSSALSFYTGDIGVSLSDDVGSCSLRFDINGVYSADGALTTDIAVEKNGDKETLAVAVFYGGDELASGVYFKRFKESS